MLLYIGSVSACLSHLASFYLRTVVSHLSFLKLLALSFASANFPVQQFNMDTGSQLWVFLASCSGPSHCRWWDVGTGGGSWEIVFLDSLRILAIKCLQHESCLPALFILLLQRGRCILNNRYFETDIGKVRLGVFTSLITWLSMAQLIWLLSSFARDRDLGRWISG